MTFHEAGLHILESAGRPLSAQEITTRAIQEGLLSHVGQIPEQTMRQRLTELARRTRDRRVAIVGPDQFALTDWGLAEDPAALAQLESAEVPPEGPPLRSRERHPPITPARGGRIEGGEAGRRKRKRLLPLPEVAIELLSEAGKPLPLDEILARARERELISDELGADTLATALAEENRKRAEAGRRPAFSIGESGNVELLVPAVEEPAAAPEASERRAPRPPPQTIDSRRNALRQVRRRLGELDAGALERVASTLLDRAGYRDVRLARRAGGEAASLLTARRRLGLTDVRFAIRLALGSEVSREQVQELRRDLVTYNAHAGIVLGAVEARGDARTEAGLVGQPLVTLLCGEALAEELVLRQVGVVTYELFQLDDGYWRTLRRSAPVRPLEPQAPEPATGPAAPPEAPAATEAAITTAPQTEAAAPSPAGGGESSPPTSDLAPMPPAPSPSREEGHGEGTADATPSAAARPDPE